MYGGEGLSDRIGNKLVVCRLCFVKQDLFRITFTTTNIKLIALSSVMFVYVCMYISWYINTNDLVTDFGEQV